MRTCPHCGIEIPDGESECPECHRTATPSALGPNGGTPRRTISSSWTFAAKFVPFTLWNVFLGTQIGPLLVDQDGVKWVPLFFWITGALMLWWSYGRIKKVEYDDEYLYVSNFLKTVRVPLSRVCEMWEVSDRVRPRHIFISFKDQTPFGRRIVFWPSPQVRQSGVSSLVRKLQTLAARDDSTADGPKLVVRRLMDDPRIIVLWGIIGLLSVAGCAGAVYYGLFFGVVKGPTLIEDVRSEAVTAADITKVEVLKVGDFAYWDWTEADYDRHDRVSLPSRDAIDEFVNLLKTKTTDGYRRRNHPQGHYRGILRISLRDGRHYYLLYKAKHSRGINFLSLDSLSAGTTNPNGGKHYENVPLSEFLEKHDPSFNRLPEGR